MSKGDGEQSPRYKTRKGNYFLKVKMAVFVLDKNKKPLMPATEKRARLLLSRGKAVVHKRYPFTIRLKGRVGGELQPLLIKLDPGSRYTGVAIVRESEQTDAASDKEQVISHIKCLFEVQHRGHAISESLTSRRAMRRRRRNQLRYRAARFNNRIRKAGWLAPSLQHRVDTVSSIIKKLIRLAPISRLAMELARFDMQSLQNPEITGVEYQQGTLFGYEVREYLLAKWHRACAYCDKVNVPLQIEHIQPKSKGGSNRVSNLTLACECCNLKKDAKSVSEFLQHDPLRLKRLLSQAKVPLKDAAAVNSTRWALFSWLKTFGLPVETASGGRTKYNRTQNQIPKAHSLDAACVGKVETVLNWNIPTIVIKCMGRGRYQRTLLNQYGFPRAYLPRGKGVKGFQTGDMVKAIVTKGKKIGTHVGRVAVRSSGYFNITTKDGTEQGISYKACTIISRNDGYEYGFQPKIA